METRDQVSYLKSEKLKLEIHPTKKSAGDAAARAVAAEIQRLQQSGRPVGVIFATGASQLNTLDSLASLPGLPWREVIGFHLDEYVGLDENHPASFRHYLRKNLTGRVIMRNFYEIDGSAKNLAAVRSEYVRKLRLVSPQLCLLGIGENGHLAFNDPAEADFNDPEAMKVVNLDTTCRQQQVAEGWFERLELVPRQALTLTIPTVFRVPKLIVSVLGNRKAQTMRHALEDPIGSSHPSTILRTHPDATIYLDADAAAALNYTPRHC